MCWCSLKPYPTKPNSAVLNNVKKAYLNFYKLTDFCYASIQKCQVQSFASYFDFANSLSCQHFHICKGKMKISILNILSLCKLLEFRRLCSTAIFLHSRRFNSILISSCRDGAEVSQCLHRRTVQSQHC